MCIYVQCTLNVSYLRMFTIVLMLNQVAAVVALCCHHDANLHLQHLAIPELLIRQKAGNHV